MLICGMLSYVECCGWTGLSWQERSEGQVPSKANVICHLVALAQRVQVHAHGIDALAQVAGGI